MPHNTTTDSRTHGNSEWGWLESSTPTTLPAQPSAPTNPTRETNSEWGWLPDDLDAAATYDESRDAFDGRPVSRTARLRWVVPIVSILVSILVIVFAVFALGGGTESTVSAPQTVTSSATQTPALTGACTGLTATTVTAGPGDPASVTGVIAAFEYAYYQQRSADAALALVTPEAGLARDPLTAGIASIPAGTMHCVAITPIADATANVHLVELHPDHTRTDYLQVINLRRTPAGLLIDNIQKQG
ncbi:hypothetical protein ACFXG4_32740 [Nocardia sp. NPDC059246]|uniref:hypothetical protein n=1 Tax=unclassified Nocardia TaxID=2637762 RepID=UPI0036C2E4E5